jgi:hypothetical protein
MPVWSIYRFNSIEEIERFHDDLRRRLPLVSGFAQLQGLKNQSDELVRMLTSRSFADRFGAKAEEALRIAVRDNEELARLATEIARKHDWNREFKGLLATVR